ncbi:unnamed protein product [Phaedon cochleariae]|uniref:Uncharacterized protein n=1 Tax=Phaedon cochleariae TaxID=80249 RepID=A0A9P0DPT5_PHACE|nr:unnamed protein product [Phaedon cochleariae]
MSTRSKLDMNNIIRDSINELFQDADFIGQLTKTLSDKIEQKLKAISEEIKSQNERLISVEQKLDSIQQQTKSNNVCIYGVPEMNNENTKDVILENLSSNSVINLQERDIISCFRVGTPSNNKKKPRPIILKFRDPKEKVKLFKNVKNLKNKSIFITEDLTHNRRILLKSAKTSLPGKKIWTFKGQIFIKINDTNVKISSMQDIQQYAG